MNKACVILAAGQGKRMKSSLPKVLHRICGLPMLQAVIDTAESLRPDRLIVVAGSHMESIQSEVAAPDIQFVMQKEPKGTGDALKSAAASLKGFRGVVIVFNGDSPLIRAGTIKRFLSFHQKGGNSVSVLSFVAENPHGYGRILRDEDDKVVAIVEEKDADSIQKQICEVNSGIYAVNHNVLPLLDGLKMNSLKGEIYLTDIVSLASTKGLRTSAFAIGDETEFMGVNTRAELLRASEILRQEIIGHFIDRGVNFIDPASAFIHPHASIGRDTIIYPNVYIEGRTVIGSGVCIYSNVRISDCIVDRGATIKDSSVLEGSRIRSFASVGPFAHIRPGSDIAANAKIGNFVELKKTIIGKGSKASHLSYLGDAVIGKGVNIGAGTITCNYDGVNKHRTEIGDGVFVGSDSQLIAPVRIGSGAYIGAGSTITKDVLPGSLAVSRTEQRSVKDWARKRRLRTEIGRKEKKH